MQVTKCLVCNIHFPGAVWSLIRPGCLSSELWPVLPLLLLHPDDRAALPPQYVRTKQLCMYLCVCVRLRTREHKLLVHCAMTSVKMTLSIHLDWEKSSTVSVTLYPPLSPSASYYIYCTVVWSLLNVTKSLQARSTTVKLPWDVYSAHAFVSLITLMRLFMGVQEVKKKRRERAVPRSSPIRLRAAPMGCLVVVQRFLCGYKGVVLWL